MKLISIKGIIKFEKDKSLQTITIWMDNYLIAGIIALFAIQITVFLKSKKPKLYYMDYAWNIMDKEQTKRAKAEVRKYKKQYHKELAQYYAVFTIPMIFTAFSFISYYNFQIGLVLFIIAVVSTIVSVVLHKAFDIGNKNFP